MSDDIYKNEAFINLIERNKYIDCVLCFLDKIGDGNIVAIEASWGNGKTTLLKQLEFLINNIFDDNYKTKVNTIVPQYTNIINSNPKNIKCIYIDSWIHEHDKIDPILSILGEIVNTLDDEYITKIEPNVKKIFSNILKVCTKGIIDGDIFNEVEDIKSFKEEHKKISNLQESIDSLFNHIIVEKYDMLYIIIDEIDRCNPSHAVKLLERIKHYFVHKNMNIIVSTDLNQINHSIKKVYGENVNSNLFLDKLFDYLIELPSLNVDMFVQKYFPSDEFKKNYIVGYYVDYYINRYSLSLRNIKKYLTIISKIKIGTSFTTPFSKTFEIIFISYFIGCKLFFHNKIEMLVNGNFEEIMEHFKVTMLWDRMQKTLKDSYNVSLTSPHVKYLLTEIINKQYSKKLIFDFSDNVGIEQDLNYHLRDILEDIKFVLDTFDIL